MTDPAEREDQASLAQLLRSAGVRPAPGAEVADRVHAAVHREYLAELTRRRTRRWAFALTAGLVLFVVGGILLQQRQPGPTVVARVTRVLGGPPFVRSSASLSAQAAAGQSLHTSEIVTVPVGSRMSLGLSNGIGLRVNASSVVAFESPVSLRLVRGEVYVETPRHVSGPRLAELTVHTAYGAVRHLGTRFEVRVTADEIRVRVRDGVAVFRAASGADTRVAAGQQLEFHGGTATVTAGPGPASDAWAWAESAAPEFPIEGRSLIEVLEWLTHESGLQLEFTDQSVRTRAAAVILHGSVSGLAPRPAIRAVMMGTNLPYTMDDTKVLVGRS